MKVIAIANCNSAKKIPLRMRVRAWELAEISWKLHGVDIVLQKNMVSPLTQLSSSFYWPTLLLVFLHACLYRIALQFPPPPPPLLRVATGAYTTTAILARSLIQNSSPAPSTATGVLARLLV